METIKPNAAFTSTLCVLIMYYLSSLWVIVMILIMNQFNDAIMNQFNDEIMT